MSRGRKSARRSCSGIRRSCRACWQFPRRKKPARETERGSRVRRACCLGGEHPRGGRVVGFGGLVQRIGGSREEGKPGRETGEEPERRLLVVSGEKIRAAVLQSESAAPEKKGNPNGRRREEPERRVLVVSGEKIRAAVLRSGIRRSCTANRRLPRRKEACTGDKEKENKTGGGYEGTRTQHS